MIQAGIVLVIAWGALAFGAVYTWAYLPLIAGCAAVGVLGLAWGRRAPGSRSNRATILALLAVIAAALAQLVPLPAGILRTLSPATDAFLQRYNLAYALGTANHPLSIDPHATVLGLGFLAGFLVFLAGMLRAFARSGVRRLVPAIVMLGVVLALIAVIQKALLGDHAYMGMKIYGFWAPESKLVVPYGPYVNRNHFAGWMLMGIPLAIGYLCALLESGTGGARDWRSRLLWFSSPQGGRALLISFAVIVMTLSLAMSMSRSGMACLAVAAVLVGWSLLRALPTPGARLAAAALFVVLIAAPTLWVGLDAAVDRFSSDSRGSLETRLHAWKDTRAIIRDFPLTGTGLNTFGTAMVLYQSGTRDVHFQESHNDYLQLLAEGGILLGLPIVVAVLLFVRTVRRRFREGGDDRTTSWIRFGAAAGVLAVALQSLVEFSLQMPGNAAFFVVLVAIAMHRPPAVARRKADLVGPTS
jgi:hypothetical protein